MTVHRRRQSYFPCTPGARAFHAPTRRDFLYSLGASVGSIAFTSMLDDAHAAPAAARNQATGHVPAKATNCIFLMMEGGPSHIDTFDPKPKLEQLHLKEFSRGGEQKSAMESGKRYFVRAAHLVLKNGAKAVRIWRRIGNISLMSPMISVSFAAARSIR